MRGQGSGRIPTQTPKVPISHAATAYNASHPPECHKPTNDMWDEAAAPIGQARLGIALQPWLRHLHPPTTLFPADNWLVGRTGPPPPPPGKHLWPFSFDDSALMTLENAYNETPCPRGKLRCRGGPKPLDEMPNTSTHWQILAETGKHGQTLANIDPGPSRISNHSP